MTISKQKLIECPNCGRVSSADGVYCNRCARMGMIPVGNMYAHKYQIGQLVAEGAMGRIYKAIETKSGRVVAIKEYLDKKTRKENARKLFIETLIREVGVLRELSIVRAVPQLFEDLTEWNGRHFFVMEFMEGENLLDALEKHGQPFSWDLVVKWGIRLCEVLQVLHNRQPDPIIYRDLKLENIAFRQRGKLNEDIVLLDFGIARHVHEGRKKTRMAGTEAYAPPEQFTLGNPEPRSDIYSLAVCMHQLLTNRDPAENPPPFPPPTDLNPLVPRWLSDMNMINLSEDPRERYESASAVRDDLMNQIVTKTIRCDNCGTENERSLIYCISCAHTLLSTPRRCPHCKEFIPANAQYCPRCGGEL